MRNQTALEDLSAKVSLIIEKYSRVRDENIMLSQELAETKKKVEELNQEILRLQENEELRELEIEEIAQKIGKLLS
jgi:peptidoglycan hydrolase CwlO-like protein